MGWIGDLLAALAGMLGMEGGKKLVSGLGLESILLIPLLLFGFVMFSLIFTKYTSVLIEVIFGLRDSHPIKYVIGTIWVGFFGAIAVYVAYDEFFV